VQEELARRRALVPVLFRRGCDTLCCLVQTGGSCVHRCEERCVGVYQLVEGSHRLLVSHATFVGQCRSLGGPLLFRLHRHIPQMLVQLVDMPQLLDHLPVGAHEFRVNAASLWG
jgi:hypothetical protein